MIYDAFVPHSHHWQIADPHCVLDASAGGGGRAARPSMPWDPAGRACRSSTPSGWATPRRASAALTSRFSRRPAASGISPATPPTSGCQNPARCTARRHRPLHRAACGQRHVGHADCEHGTGARISVSVNFDEPVWRSGDAPSRAQLSGSSRAAAYASGDGTLSFVFGYTWCPATAPTTWSTMSRRPVGRHCRRGGQRRQPDAAAPGLSSRCLDRPGCAWTARATRRRPHTAQARIGIVIARGPVHDAARARRWSSYIAHFLPHAGCHCTEPAPVPREGPRP